MRKFALNEKNWFGWLAMAFTSYFMKCVKQFTYGKFSFCFLHSCHFMFTQIYTFDKIFKLHKIGTCSCTLRSCVGFLCLFFCGVEGVSFQNATEENFSLVFSKCFSECHRKASICFESFNICWEREIHWPLAGR